MIFCHLGFRTGLSCHNVRGEKEQGYRVLWMSAKACGCTCMMARSLICVHLFGFLSELYVTSGRGATRVSMDY